MFLLIDSCPVVMVMVMSGIVSIDGLELTVKSDNFVADSKVSPTALAHWDKKCSSDIESSYPTRSARQV